MTDRLPRSASTEPAPQPTARRRAGSLILAAALAVGLIGASATSSFSQGFGPGFGPGWRMFGGPLDPARVEERADRMIRHVGVELDATAEQQDKLRAIVKGALKDLLPVRDQMLAARQQARDLLTQPTVDRAALEKLRTERIAAADTASKRLVQALADAAEVLTPEQRKKLNDLIPAAGGWRGRGWGMGWHGFRGFFWRGGPQD
jgi:Spy/CpxP family protein refolding chaperone